MAGRKIAKRKRHCLEICNLKWSKPGKKDVGCQVKIYSAESSPSKITESVGTQTEISFALSSQSTLPEQVNTAAMYETREFSPQRLHDFCVNFTNNKQDTRNTEHGKDNDAHETVRKAEHSEDDGEHKTVRKVDGFFKSKDHQLEDLTSKSLCIKPSSLVISTSDVMRDAVSESKCGRCGKSGKFKFVEETEPQTGVLNLEFICSDCQKRFSITSNNDIIRTGTKPKTYLTNYVLLAFIACGEYYKDYDHVMGTLGIGHFSEKQWIRVIEWIAPEVEKIAKWSVQQSRKLVRARGDQDKLEVMFHGFYLTRGHYSNNASATMHDAKTGNIIGYAHQTKRGQGANWEGTSGGAEGNMLDEILADLIDNEHMNIKKAIIDKDASCQEVLLSRSPETEIVYCGNHTAKTFHTDLERVKKTPCQVCFTLVPNRYLPVISEFIPSRIQYILS